jgi:hypothetical protein
MSNVEVQLGASNRLQWFLDDWEECDVNSLRDIMPSVKIIYMRVDRVSALPEMTEDEEHQMQEDMETIAKWPGDENASKIRKVPTLESEE